MQLSPRSRPEPRAASRAKLQRCERITLNALEQRHIVQHVLAFASADGYLFAGCVARLWRESWIGEPPPRGRTGGSNAAESGDGAGGSGAVVFEDALKLPKLTSLSAVVQSVSRTTWALRSGLDWSSRLSAEAARVERGLDVLRWGLEVGHLRFGNGPKNQVGLLQTAAAAGQLATIKWARASGSAWEGEVIAWAADHGQLHVIKWARANGRPWGNYSGMLVCSAARFGFLDVVEWLWASGCPRTPQLAVFAAAAGAHLEVLRWLRAQGCIWHHDACDFVGFGGSATQQREVFAYIHALADEAQEQEEEEPIVEEVVEDGSNDSSSIGGGQDDEQQEEEEEEEDGSEGSSGMGAGFLFKGCLGGEDSEDEDDGWGNWDDGW